MCAKSDDSTYVKQVHELQWIYIQVHANPRVLHRVPDEIKKRKVVLDPQVSPEEIMSREVELGYESWTSFALGCSSTAVQRTLSS